MQEQLKQLRVALVFSFFGLILGISLGIAFGVYEDAFKDYVADGIAANPTYHKDPEKAQSKIWRYAQRTHFHAMGIAATSIGLIFLVLLSGLSNHMKSLAATLISMINLYPLAWLNMYIMSPSIGREAAHGHFITEWLTYASTIGLVVGLIILIGNLFLGLFQSQTDHSAPAKDKIA